MNWIIYAIAVLGFIPLLIVLLKRRRNRQLRLSGECVSGMVEKVEERVGFRGSRYYQAQIRYGIGGGVVQRSIYTFASSRKRALFTVGQPLELYYDRDHPKKFILKDIPDSPGLLIFTIIIAVGYLVICYFLQDLLRSSH